MAKCPYCARHLRRGVWCRACRRYVLRWPHLVLLVLAALAVVLGLLEILSRVG